MNFAWEEESKADSRLDLDVEIVEVGLRDGIQAVNDFIPTGLKVLLIEKLVEAGLKWIQVTSFVHPKRVPQLKDAELLIEKLPHDQRALFSALVLNKKGLDRALGTDIGGVDLSLSASEKHSLKNTGLSKAEALAQVREMMKRAKKAGRQTRVGIQCIFGHPDEEGLLAETLELVAALKDHGADYISLADSTGQGDPEQMDQLLLGLHRLNLREAVIMHLHDTHGRGMANAAVALKAGVRHFDTAFGGLGGCPFIAGAKGNLATELFAKNILADGYRTEVDSERVLEVARMLADHWRGFGDAAYLC